MPYNVPNVRISLENWPPTGDAGVSMRIRDQDRDMISDAARMLGMRQSDFLRMVTVNSAREVLRQIDLQRELEGLANDRVV